MRPELGWIPVMAYVIHPQLPPHQMVNHVVPMGQRQVLEKIVPKPSRLRPMDSSMSGSMVSPPNFLQARLVAQKRELASIRPVELPRPILPFPIKTNIHSSVRPLGEVDPRNEQEQWLRQQLTEIYQANRALFGPLSIKQIRTSYDEDSTRIAMVDLTGLHISIGPAAFDRTTNKQEVVAILCHELAHILLGHQSFSTLPPAWVEEQPQYQQHKQAVEGLHQAIDVNGVADVFRQLQVARAALGEEYDGMCEHSQGQSRAVVEDHSQGLQAKILPGNTQQSKKKAAAGKTALNKDKASVDLDDYAKTSHSPNARQYLRLLDLEKRYQTSVEQWLGAQQQLNQIVDRFLGEKGAWRNWKEEQADTLGFRLFLYWMNETNTDALPDDYINALVNTLSRKEPDLPTYWHQLINAPDIHQVPPPERCDNSHPTGKWRVYNLLVRELHLRYPKEYRTIIEQGHHLGPVDVDTAHRG